MRSRKGLALILALSMILTSGFQVHATESEEQVVALSDEDRDLVIEGGVEGVDYTYEEGVVTILTATTISIKNRISGATSDRVIVPSGVNADLVLAGINIVTTQGSPIELVPNAAGNGAKAHITLAKGTNNILTSDCIRYPGLRCGKSTSVTIDDDVKNTDSNGNNIVPKLGKIPYDTTLINGVSVKEGESLTKLDSIEPGTLTILGGNCASALGGGFAEDGGNITINGGKINATARGSSSSDDNGGAGIGGGGQASGGNITINGGNITAQGAYHGSGIGGGYAYSTSSSVSALPGALPADAWD